MLGIDGRATHERAPKRPEDEDRDSPSEQRKNRPVATRGRLRARRVQHDRGNRRRGNRRRRIVCGAHAGGARSSATPVLPPMRARLRPRRPSWAGRLDPGSKQRGGARGRPTAGSAPSRLPGLVERQCVLLGRRRPRVGVDAGFQTARGMRAGRETVQGYDSKGSGR